MKKILFYLIILLFLGCGESHKRQIALIKDYEQNFNGVKTDLKLKVLEIERIGTYPVDSLKIVSSSREERFKKYEDLMKIINDKKLEKELRKMEKLRISLRETLDKLRDQNDNLILEIDNILFDNIMMLDKIFQNFNKLNQLKS